MLTQTLTMLTINLSTKVPFSFLNIHSSTFYFFVTSNQLVSSLPSWLLLIPLLSFTVSCGLFFIFNKINCKNTNNFTKTLCKIPTGLIFLNVLIVICLITRFVLGEASYASWDINNFKFANFWPFVLISWDFYASNATLWVLLALNSISFFLHFYFFTYIKKIQIY